MLFFMCCYYGVYPWRLCPRSTKTAVSSTFTACFVRRLVRCAYLLRLPLPQNGPEARGSDSPWAIPTRRLQERPVFYLSWNFEEFWAGSHFRHGFFFSLDCVKTGRASVTQAIWVDREHYCEPVKRLRTIADRAEPRNAATQQRKRDAHPQPHRPRAERSRALREGVQQGEDRATATARIVAHRDD